MDSDMDIDIDMEGKPSPTFHPFSKLPAELRDHIWAEANPEPRIFEVLDAPPCAVDAQACPFQNHQAKHAGPASPRQSSPASRLMFADTRIVPPPAIARVCRDARATVLRRYKPVIFAGTLKYIDFSRDIILLDSYLQVKRLLKVVRLLSQIESFRKNVTSIALGTSWGLNTGLHLRLFHRTVQTKQNMTKFLQYLSTLRRLKTLVLVAYQQSADHTYQWLEPCSVALPLQRPPHPTAPDLHHRPPHAVYQEYCHVRSDILEMGTSAAWDRQPRQNPDDRDGKHEEVHDLKRTFEDWMKKASGEGGLRDYQPPEIQTATLTWAYTGVRTVTFYCEQSAADPRHGGGVGIGPCKLLAPAPSSWHHFQGSG